MNFQIKHIRDIAANLKHQTRRLALVKPKWPAIGEEYAMDIYIAWENDWFPANVNRVDFPGRGVYRRTGWDGGWLTGDSCVEPDWWDVPKWIEGNHYAVGPGRGRPAIWLLPDRYGHKWLPVEVDRAKDHLTGKTFWELAKGLKDPHQWFLNEGFKPLRIKVLKVWSERLQGITPEDAVAEGCYDAPDPVAAYREVWNSINTRKGTRWEDNPLVWAINFKLNGDWWRETQKESLRQQKQVA